MEGFMSIDIFIIILATGVRLATPFLLAALGEMFVQRSGVYNLGVEGIMMMGAFAGFFATLQQGSPLLGIIVSLAIGALMGLIMAFVSVTFKAEQGISGIGLYMFGWGLSGLLFRLYVGGVTSIDGLKPIAIPMLSDIPLIGQVLFNHNVLVYTAFLLVPLSGIILYKTSWGLNVRAVGNKPEAADTLGVSVVKIRYQCLIVGGMLAALAGAFLTIGQANMYADNITAGRGFIAIALVYFGRWSPWGILLGSLLFSMADSFQSMVQVLGINFPYELAVILPYMVTIIALAISYGRVWAPAALGKPYERGTRG
ncbi:ABC transporter permease [Desulfosporosinus hippei]|uniref:Simple sugar transport system permease protein n=1 Tax=Desulfosporosinus hippei DSM 8344 TaxID=1121419 RepID=A0A1G7WE30_9FIRM|nr:ABC transporter permease [Desulfosporosinus hippei]SDG70231.1 simple sugar transport system permease protein [Desulfosporosinus hippei DSM 8344]